MTLQTMYVETDPQPATPATTERRRHFAYTLCEGAANSTSWRMADRLAKVWLDCGCEALGVSRPDERLTG